MSRSCHSRQVSNVVGSSNTGCNGRGPLPFPPAVWLLLDVVAIGLPATYGGHAADPFVIQTI